MMRKEKILSILLLAVSVYLTAYAISAHMVSSHIIEDYGKAYWSSSPEGSLFPWPRKSGGSDIGIPVLIELNETDSFIYNYLIKTYLLSAVCILLWLLAIIIFYRRANIVKSTLSR